MNGRTGHKVERFYILDENDDSIDDYEMCSNICEKLVMQCRLKLEHARRIVPIKLSQSTCHSSSTKDGQSTDDLQRTVRIPQLQNLHNVCV